MASSISIHSLRMEGDGFSIIYSFLTCISIHSLRMEGDDLFLHSISTRQTFQSTPSAWRETRTRDLVGETYHIFQSTPSAWRETFHFCYGRHYLVYFNPLPPHGGRRRCRIHLSRIQHFNPLPPHGGRLYGSYTGNGMRDFNPLPPHGGRRHEGRYHQGIDHHFNPLPPHGGRPSV